MTATAEVYFTGEGGRDKLCKLHGLTINMAGGILMVSGDIQDAHEDIDMFADIIHVAGENGHKTKLSVSPLDAIMVQGTISDVTITADGGSQTLKEEVDYKLDREAGFIIFQSEAKDVRIDYSTDGYETYQGGGGVKGRKTDDHALDLRIECNINGFTVTMHMTRPFIYRKEDGRRLHIRSERFPAE